MAQNGFSQEELLQSAPFFTTGTRIAFQDIDAAGVVYFGRYLDYCVATLFELLRVRGCSVAEAITQQSWVAPQVHVEVDYLKPLYFEEQLASHLVQRKVEGSNLWLGYRLEHAPSGEPVAVAQTHQVFVDPVTRKRTRIPDSVLKALEPSGP